MGEIVSYILMSPLTIIIQEKAEALRSLIAHLPTPHEYYVESTDWQLGYDTAMHYAAGALTPKITKEESQL